MHDIASQQTESSALLPPALRQTQAAVSVVLSGAIYWVIPALHPSGMALYQVPALLGVKAEMSTLPV